MAFTQMKMDLAVVLLLAALLGRVTCGSTIIKVPPIKPGEMNQTIVVNIPPTVDVERTVQRGNNTSAQLILQQQPQSAGEDCLLSDCDENDVGCDGLAPCGPLCPPEACPRVNCTQCWQTGSGGPCCWSCCSQYMPYTYPQQHLTPPQQRHQTFYTYTQQRRISTPQQQAVAIPQQQAIPIPQQEAIPLPQPQPIPIPQPQPIPIPQQDVIQMPQLQAFQFAQSQAFPIPQLQPFPFPQPQPIPIAVPQPQPIPIPLPRPMPSYPIAMPQPYAVPQPIPYPQFQPQLQFQPMPQQILPQQASAYMPSQCRQIPSWPFLQCPQTPNCREWYQPGCVPQSTYPNLCYTVGTC